MVVLPAAFFVAARGPAVELVVTAAFLVRVAGALAADFALAAPARVVVEVVFFVAGAFVAGVAFFVAGVAFLAGAVFFVAGVRRLRRRRVLAGVAFFVARRRLLRAVTPSWRLRAFVADVAFFAGAAFVAALAVLVVGVAFFAGAACFAGAAFVVGVRLLRG